MKTVFEQLIRRRQLVADVVAASIICAAVSASFLLRFEFAVQPADLPMLRTGLALALGIKLTIFRLCGLRQLAWRHLGFDDLLRITLTHVGASVTWTGAVLGVSGAAFPRSICVLDFVLCLGLEVATRAAIRLLFEVPSRRQTDRRRVLIFGAGKAGVQLLNDVRLHPELGLQVIGFLDDDVRKHGMRLQGSRVAGGRRELAEVAAQLGADEVWIALPAASGHDISEIVEQCHLAHLASRRVPALAELVEGKVLVEQIREVRIEDL
ncbi:MAG: hypothetical protein RL328_883, partial [Acidobacteriota bacterium]